MKTASLLAMLALAVVGAVRSQTAPKLAFRGDGAMVWMRSDAAGGIAQLRGPVLGGEGRVVFPSIAIGLGLLSGTLHAPGGGTAQSDLIEGRLFVAARALPWLEMSLGPAVRAYVTDAATERWVFWQARARVDAPIVPGRLTTYLEAWRALSSQVNLTGGAGRVQGGEAGVVYQPPRRPFWLRLAYRVDDAAFGGAAGMSETLEAISVAVGVGN